MSRLRRQLILLILSMLLFFTLASLSLGQINIQAPILILAAGAVLAELTLPVFGRKPVAFSLLVGVLAYLILRFYLMAGTLWTGILDFQVSMIELFFLVWLIYLAHLVVNEIQTAETARNFVDLTKQFAAAPDLQTSEDRIRSELTRSRHYHRPLSLVVIDKPNEISEPALERMVNEIQNWIVGGYVQARLSQVMKRELRAIDLIMTDHNRQRLVILCPEVDAEGVTELTDHLKMAVSREMGLRIQCGSASFPDESLTFDGLLQRATEKLNYPVFSQGNNQPLSRHSLPTAPKD